MQGNDGKWTKVREERECYEKMGGVDGKEEYMAVFPN